MSTLRETLAEHVLDDAGCWCGLPEANPNKWAAHLETVVLAWVGARLAGAREDVAIDVWRRYRLDQRDAESITRDALTAVSDALGVPVAPAGGEVGLGSRPTLTAEQAASIDVEALPLYKPTSALGVHGHADEVLRPADRQPGGSTGVVCPIDTPHGPHGIQTFIAGGEPGPVPLLWGRWCPGRDATTCEACPFLGCDSCEAETTRRAKGEAK